MKASRLLLLLVALLAGGLAAWLATRGGGDTPPDQPQTTVVQEARAKVLVAKMPVGVGEKIIDDDIEWQDWPEGAVRAEFITEAASPNAITDIRGSVARFEIFPGEPILSSKLVKADQGYLSAVLDKGRRGVSITVAAEAASGGFIVPNDHVDVVLTRSTGQGPVSEVLLTNVRVLAINARLGETGKTGAPDDGSTNEKGDPKSQVFANSAIATLDLDPGQAETVINATQQGKLSLALRSIVDFPQTETTTAEVQRNAAIKIIRYGVQANVTAPTSPTAGGASVDNVAYPLPTVQTTISTGPGADGAPLAGTAGY